MLKRIAVLLWWCAAVIGAGGIYGGIYEWRQVSACAPIIHAWQARLDKDSQPYKLTKPEEQCLARSPNKSGLDLLDCYQPRTATTVSETVHSAEQACLPFSAMQYSWAVVLLMALPFLALAYVLGGSFWLPPR